MDVQARLAGLIDVGDYVRTLPIPAVGGCSTTELFEQFAEEKANPNEAELEMLSATTNVPIPQVKVWCR